MKNNIYYINIRRKRENNAGMKAPEDIAQICKSLGMKEFYMPQLPAGKHWIYAKIWLLFVCAYYYIKLGRSVAEGDIVLYQHPAYGNRAAEKFIPLIQRKNVKFIALIHDLETLRKMGLSQSTCNVADNILLKHFDAIICHNEHMRKYLITQEFDDTRLVNLGIFDYLCGCKGIQPIKGEHPSIAIAGNLAIGKCSYIYNIFGADESRNSNLTVHLYGNNYDKSNSKKNMIYHGAYKPDELPKYLEGDFGLVWDGTSADTCAGNTGEYLRYNNPHKTSLYLAGGMPVIVWRQSAIADFVLENGVGFAVESLYVLEQAIANISNEEYAIMCENVKRVGEKIRAGYYFKTALEKCVERLG